MFHDEQGRQSRRYADAHYGPAELIASKLFQPISLGIYSWCQSGLRLSSQGTHLWAERFDGARQGLFELQDANTSQAGGCEPAIRQPEIE